MLETSQERVGLLKAGMSIKKMEELYLISNSFRIVRIPVLFEAVEVIEGEKRPGFFCEFITQYVNA